MGCMGKFNGRRGGLKILWGNPCGFESHPGHHTPQVAQPLRPTYYSLTLCVHH